MHPAPSIIVFTVLSGLGLGMMFWTGIGLGSDSAGYGWFASIAILLITGVGGAASAGHLGRPDRAWRAFSQWRSSWLSREACLMVAVMALFLLYAAIWLFTGARIALLGWLSALLALATVYATAMIYAQLRTVPRWSGTPTPALFLILSLAGGLLGVGALMGLAGSRAPGWFILGALLIATGVVVWWQTAAAGALRGLYGSTPETATGLGGIGQVRLLEPPHTGSNYLLKEMAFHVGRARAAQLKKLGFILCFLVPIVLTMLSLLVGGWLLVLALLCHVAGVLSFRWLFFAEAEHAQALYYGQR